MQNRPDGRDVRRKTEETAITQQAGPQLDADDAEDEEHEEAQQQHVAKHRKRVQQQHHQYSQICNHIDQPASIGGDSLFGMGQQVFTLPSLYLSFRPSPSSPPFYSLPIPSIPLPSFPLEVGSLKSS